ncbi:MAG: Rossmann-like and DUF2520 domain-containing protein [Actinomycetota bacterium]
MDVGVVGAGRVGTALAVLLRRAGHRVVAASGGQPSRERAARFLPHVPFGTSSQAAAAEVVLVGVPDDALAPVCDELAAGGAFRAGQAVVHLSGSVALDVLDPAAAAGAEVLSVHPLQTFPGVEEAVERLPGSAVAVTARTEAGFSVGERVASDAGGRPFRLDDRWKPLYHAAAVFVSNYLTAVVAVGEGLFRRAGIAEPAEVFGPLARASLDNVLRLGAAGALTGPAVRGDAGTIRRNLEALSEHAPESVPAYVALAGVALEVAERAGHLEASGRARVERELAAWS